MVAKTFWVVKELLRIRPSPCSLRRRQAGQCSRRVIGSTFYGYYMVSVDVVETVIIEEFWGVFVKEMGKTRCVGTVASGRKLFEPNNDLATFVI